MECMLRAMKILVRNPDGEIAVDFYHQIGEAKTIIPQSNLASMPEHYSWVDKSRWSVDVNEDHALCNADLGRGDAATESVLFAEIRKCVSEVRNDRLEFPCAKPFHLPTPPAKAGIAKKKYFPNCHRISV